MGGRSERRTHFGLGRRDAWIDVSNFDADDTTTDDHTSSRTSQSSNGGTRMKRILTTSALLSLCWTSAWSQDIPAEYQQVLTTLGKQGDYKANVLKVNIPRNDVNVTVANVKTPTPFGFGGWVAMTKGTGGMDVMMGDLVLLQEEVNPVIDRKSVV